METQSYAQEAGQQQQQQQPLYTCLSCLVGFHSPLDQRTHYRSDLHRYNMKRQVAGLPPVRQDVFEHKVQQRQGEASTSTAATSSAEQQDPQQSQRPRCKDCAKSFASAGAYASHVNSKKHKETVAKVNSTASTSSTTTAPQPSKADEDADGPLVFRVPANAMSGLSSDSGPIEATEELRAELPNTMSSASSAAAAGETTASDAASSSTRGPQAPTSLVLSSDATDAEVEAAISARLASSSRIDPAKSCIFCPSSSFSSLEASLAHMQRSHGFFLPEAPYLIDMAGLVQYLADKVSVGHLCLYCNGRGRGFNTADAVKKHMLDKSHCKVAYEREEDKMELSDFYDFSSSYPDYVADEDEEDAEMGSGAEDDEGWEDMDEDGASIDDEDDEPESVLPSAPGVTYGDSPLELVLPSGARLGHRSLARYYRQTLFSTPASHQSSLNTSSAHSSGSALARRLISSSTSSNPLAVTSRNGSTSLAHSKGQAKFAQNHVREFRDTKRREEYKTRIGFRNNNQKHFRDPLLQ